MQMKKCILPKFSSLSILTLLFMLTLYIASVHGTWALEQKNVDQPITKENNNFIRSGNINKINDNESSLTTRSQDTIVNKITSFFNEPNSVNRSVSVQPCITHDFRCCILNSKSCIPVATITSVIDGDGIPIPLHGVTSSKEITFTFTSFVKFGGAGFECSLDHSGFKLCMSPFTVKSLVHADVNIISRHEFEVRMLGMDPEDSPEARFIWFIVQR
jgi:hypothetical protein